MSVIEVEVAGLADAEVADRIDQLIRANQVLLDSSEIGRVAAEQALRIINWLGVARIASGRYGRGGAAGALFCLFEVAPVDADQDADEARHEFGRQLVTYGLARRTK